VSIYTVYASFEDFDRSDLNADDIETYFKLYTLVMREDKRNQSMITGIVHETEYSAKLKRLMRTLDKLNAKITQAPQV